MNDICYKKNIKTNENRMFGKLIEYKQEENKIKTFYSNKYIN